MKDETRRRRNGDSDMLHRECCRFERALGGILCFIDGHGRCVLDGQLCGVEWPRSAILVRVGKRGKGDVSLVKAAKVVV